MQRSRKLALSLILGLSLTLAVVGMASWATPEAVPTSVNTGQHFFPPYENARDRFGFDSGSLSGYDVAQLHAGWYSNWAASLNPAHPDQLVYVQVITFHPGDDPRDPSQVTSSPDKARIAAIVAAHPGSLWMLGIEPDSLYLGNPILPEVYAIVYHDYFKYIKGLDPTAIVANGGIVQPTPCRLEYLDIVFDTYWATFSETMPVDVWNIHAFVLREVYGSWGASTPPGVDPSCAMDYTVNEAADIGIFADNLRAMRAWMKDKGYQDRPLIVSEYGILWPQWFAPQFTPAAVGHFMTQTFDLFLNAPDLEVGYPADDYRLVQAWAWYSLSDDQMYNGYLYHSSSKTLSEMGEAFAGYTAALSDTLYVDLSASLSTGVPTFLGGAGLDVSGSLTCTLPLTAHVSNLGKLAAPDALIRFEIVSAQEGAVVFEKEQSISVPARFNGIVSLPGLTATISASDLHELWFFVDPLDAISEPREGNNVVTATLDLRPDWALLGLDYQVIHPDVQSSTLALTTTVHNQGFWPSPATDVPVSLRTINEGTLRIPQVLQVPAIAPGQQVTLTGGFSVSAGLYELRMVLDAENITDEPRTDNNAISATLDLRPDLLPLDLNYRLLEPSGTLLMSSTVHNQGAWPSLAVSVTVYLETWPEATRLETELLSVPRISAGGNAPLATGLSWPEPGQDFAKLVVDLDSGHDLLEQDEDNNQDEVLISMASNFIVVPTATTVFTSGSGLVQLIFPPGAVTTPTEMRYVPLWPAGWSTIGLEPSNIAFSLTTVVSDQASPLVFGMPVSLTVRYDETDVPALKEKHLRFFVQGDRGGWSHAACRPYRRDVESNRLETALCHTGRFLFWDRYDVYFWVIVHEDTMPDDLVPEDRRPRSPLLLPGP